MAGILDNPVGASPVLQMDAAQGILGGGVRAAGPMPGLNPTKFAPAGESVSGLTVHPEIPNQGSIEGSISNPMVLPGVREVPFSAFEDSGAPKFYSKGEETRTRALADNINTNGYIKPLIIAEEASNPTAGPYVVEGAHRFDALKLLGKQSFPALVVHDLGK